MKTFSPFTIFPSRAAVIPVTTDNRIYLVPRLLRPTGEVNWELPGGAIQDGEDCFEAGRRILEETLECDAARWHFSGLLTGQGSHDGIICLIAHTLPPPIPAMEKICPEYAAAAMPRDAPQPFYLGAILKCIRDGVVNDVTTIAAVPLWLAWRSKELTNRVPARKAA